MDFPPSDKFNIRCPRLGHQIYFSYCRAENNGLPCFKTLDCWHVHFDVEKFLKNELTDREWKKIFSEKPRPKMLSLLELIEKAKNKKS